MNLYKKCTAKPSYLSVNYTTLVSDNPEWLRNNILELRKLVMNIGDKIHKEMKNASMTLTEKQQKY